MESDDDDDFRNADWDDDDERNAGEFRNRRRKKPMVVYRYAAPAPWQRATPPKERSVLRRANLGEYVDAATQVLAALNPLPNAPTAQEDARANLQNLFLYQTALALYAKRNEQFRTLGALAKTFLK